MIEETIILPGIMNYLLLCIAATCIVANTNAFDLPDIDCNDERGSGIDQTMIARNIKRTLFGSISDENSAHDKEYKAHRANELIKIYCYSKYFTNVVAAAGQFIETQNPTNEELKNTLDAYHSNDFKDLTEPKEGTDDEDFVRNKLSNMLEDAAVESLGNIGKPLQIALKMFNKVATVASKINREEKDELINERLAEWKRIQIPEQLTNQAKKCTDVGCAEKIIGNAMSFFWRHNYLPKVITMAMHGSSKWEEAAAFSGRGRLDKFASTPESFDLAMESGAIAVQIAQSIGWKQPGTGDPFDTKASESEKSEKENDWNAFPNLRRLVPLGDDWHIHYDVSELSVHHQSIRPRKMYEKELYDTMNKMCEENDCFFDPKECCERCQKDPFCRGTFSTRWYAGDVCDCVVDHSTARQVVKENLHHYDRMLEHKKQTQAAKEKYAIEHQDELQEKLLRSRRRHRRKRGGHFSPVKGFSPRHSQTVENHLYSHLTSQQTDT